MGKMASSLLMALIMCFTLAVTASAETSVEKRYEHGTRDIFALEPTVFPRGEISVAVLKSDNSLWVWGDNWDGDIGNGKGFSPYYDYKRARWIKPIVTTPYKLLENVRDFDGVGSWAIKQDGSLWVWGQLKCYHFTKLMDGVKLPYTAQATAPTPALKVTVGGNPVQWTDATPYIDDNNRTMVPLRAVGDALGLAVDWDGAAREAVFSDGSKTIYFPIDKTVARTSGGDPIQMDTAAIVIDGRTYAPIRYLAEYFGHTVGWDGASRTVIVQ